MSQLGINPQNPQNPSTGSYTVNAPKSARTGKFVPEHNRHPDARMELSQQDTNTANRDPLDEWRDHPWWPAINYAHETIRKLFPEYQVLQIKEKFGGLRYYWSIDNDDSHPNFAHAEAAIRYAEGWVDGYESTRSPRKPPIEFPRMTWYHDTKPTPTPYS